MPYRLLSYQSFEGPRAGVAVGDTVYDLARSLARPAYASVLGVLNDWPLAQPLLEQFSVVPEGTGVSLQDVKLLVPVLYPGTIYCAGANYTDHVVNMAKKQGFEPDPDPHTLGLNPWHFIKASRCAVAQNSRVGLTSGKLDWEAELALVIGTPARSVTLDAALDHVAGYMIGNDLSARDLTRRPHIADHSPFKFDWIGQKNFDGACPLGPWIVPARQIGDPQSLGIKLWINGTLKQDSSTSRMIFTIAEQISHLSSRITLYPGDVILTGTPSGVGAERDEFLKCGDTIKIAIERIGELVTYIG